MPIAQQIFVLLAILSLLISGGLIIYYSRTRRKQAEKKWLESKNLTGVLISHVKDYAIFMVDPDGKVQNWNSGACLIKGYTEQEIIGRSISIFYTDEENARGEPAHNLRMAHQEGRYECVGLRKRKDGSQFFADVVLTALYDEKGTLTGFIKITKDITAQIKIREDLGKALTRERELNEMKSRFLALASHEFKTPLSVIQSSVNLIEKYQAPEMADKRIRHIDRIKSNVNNLKQLLSDFLSLEKLEEGLIHNDPVRTDLVKMANEVMQDLEEARKDGQQIQMDIDGTSRDFPVDRHLLRNILNNLLSNAIKYSPPGSPIQFRLDFEENTVKFSITDHGIGIPPEEQPHLFERFFRAGNTGGISGTGLGLSIVKKYLDLMGGSISVKSHPDEGSTFSISIPASYHEISPCSFT